MSPRRRRRKLTLPSLLLVLVVAVIGGAWYGGALDGLTDQVDPGPAEPGDPGDVDAERARALLAELTVAEWGSTSGYSRDRFPHWRQRDGCDTRDLVLRRDGEGVAVADDSCDVSGGTWHSRYDGAEITDPSEIDIDHTVPLANAWRTGADAWDDERRAEFANDLDRPQLLAVSASSNRAKGDQDPAQWKPPERGYWCEYAHDWVVVKHYWELSVTAAERDALDDMLGTCG